MPYVQNLFNYTKRKSSEITIGTIKMGGEYPIRIQSMTNTSTMDTSASVAQVERIIDAGGELVRLTAQGEREAENLKYISQQLRADNYTAPLVADIHFNPKAAEVAAQYVEKVRINPGNFIDAARTFKSFEYTDEEYAAELERLRNRLIPLLNICKEHHTAIRIGVNHGSLSDRIMSRYGDTPFGMVESCMEFLRICCEEQFFHVAISIKASNTVVMVQTVRLLVIQMQKEGMKFPLHLGVTEAGDGEDGRIKSAVGIGALLADGIGDTIRVSLSEDPEAEIPVAKLLAEYMTQREGHTFIKGNVYSLYTTYETAEPFKKPVQFHLPHTPFPMVVQSNPVITASGLKPDFATAVNETNDTFVWCNYTKLNDELIEFVKNSEGKIIILTSSHQNLVGELRAAIHKLMTARCVAPIVLAPIYNESSIETLQIKAAADMGSFFIDGLADGLYIINTASNITTEQLVELSFGILQAARTRVTKTEFISCPGCGRTLFNLQSTLARVKSATAHLKGLKVGVMGCIVNGPGEMADADYGYVGAARGKVSLYKGKECIEKNIDEREAVDKLIQLIKDCGDWKDPE